MITAAAVSVTLLVLGTATGLHSSGASTDGPPDDNYPDRVIYVEQLAPHPVDMLISSDGDKGRAFVADQDEFPVLPEPGQTVRIIYLDAVTDVTTESDPDSAKVASCTQSITVYTPYKSSNRPVVYGSAMISSGCGGARGFTLRLYGSNRERAANSVTVPNSGSWWGINALGDVCTYGFNSGYYGIGSWNNGGNTWSATATLPCSYP